MDIDAVLANSHALESLPLLARPCVTMPRMHLVWLQARLPFTGKTVLYTSNYYRWQGSVKSEATKQESRGI